MTGKRLAGPDIIRCIAIFLVMTIHSINYSGLLDVRPRSLQWTLIAALYHLTKTCVPLFLLLTGFLQSRRTLSRRHYISILPVLISYLVILLPSLILKALMIDGALPAAWQLGLQLLNFQGGYSWYVEMYLCLFLLIPFLNILYSALTRPQKKILLATLIFLTMLPAITKSVVVSGTLIDLFPDFLENLYPVTYYFIGAYIAEYRPAPKPLAALGTAAGVLLLETGLYYLQALSPDRWRFFNSYASLPHAVLAVCLFLAFYRIEAIRPRFLGGIIREISVCSFEMYLLSYLTDAGVYHLLPAPWAMPLSFLLAYLAARLLRLILVPLTGRLQTRLIAK